MSEAQGRTTDEEYAAEAEPSGTQMNTPARLQKQRAVAELLEGMLADQQIDRAELAQRLGWKPGRLTRVLGGKENLSLATLSLVTEAAGMDFDVVVRPAQEAAEKGRGRGRGTGSNAEATQHRNHSLSEFGTLGTLTGITVGIAALSYLALHYFATDYLQPLSGALLAASIFMLARAQWKLLTLRRELRALKRYRAQQSAPPAQTG